MWDICIRLTIIRLPVHLAILGGHAYPNRPHLARPPAKAGSFTILAFAIASRISGVVIASASKSLIVSLPRTTALTVV